MNKLLCFGLGYSAKVLARRKRDEGWLVSGTSRNRKRADEFTSLGVKPYIFSGTDRNEDLAGEIQIASHLLVSIGPTEEGDPVLFHYEGELKKARQLQWVGYLSTVGVYGDWDGEWVDETTPLRPVSIRAKRRVKAEQRWLDLLDAAGLPVHVFRIAGIYGPGRSPLEKLRDGTSRRIAKPGQVFNRIHVEDIATVLEASIARPKPGAIYNVCDDEPAPPQAVIKYGAKLLGLEPPPEVPFEEADMTPMARSFYGENKRVSNKRLREELGVDLAYPTYREGLKAVAQTMR